MTISQDIDLLHKSNHALDNAVENDNVSTDICLIQSKKEYECNKSPQSILSRYVDRRYIQAAPYNTLRHLTNSPKKKMTAKIQGPAIIPDEYLSLKRRGEVGSTEYDVTFERTVFDSQRTEFQNLGKALAPDNVGSMVQSRKYGFDHPKSVNYIISIENRIQSKVHQKKIKNKKQKRKLKEWDESLVMGDDDAIIYGIWAPSSNEIKKIEDDKLTELQKVGGVESELPSSIRDERAYIKERDRRRTQIQNSDACEGAWINNNENRYFDKVVERKMSHLLPPTMEENPKPVDPMTLFHGNEEFDYRGRSWIDPPPGWDSVKYGDIEHHKCYVPKKCVHRFTGHDKGVHCIQLFPNTGHLLLSSGLDGKCKVWSIDKKAIMRTYIGHNLAVRDIKFSNDGMTFLSASFDRYIRLWDTESGNVLNTFTNRRVPYVVQFYPHDNNFFVVGCSDHRIITYNSTTGEVTQEYNHHLAPVNTILFVDENGTTKMITSSDDKKVLIWEWDIGIPIKYISDPTMHSMPAASLHPSGSYMVFQSLDNKIVVYQAADRFTIQRKKKFEGHHVAGYACNIFVSPDGRFICSGDGEGKLVIWDWKSGRLLQKYNAHNDGPTIGCVWHPVIPSVIFTCGWDGVIKMWR